jgi:hypothetical protein
VGRQTWTVVPFRKGPRVDQVERCVRAAGREQPHALTDDHSRTEAPQPSPIELDVPAEP